jgi:hypothetical protein
VEKNRALKRRSEATVSHSTAVVGRVPFQELIIIQAIKRCAAFADLTGSSLMWSEAVISGRSLPTRRKSRLTSSSRSKSKARS